jgi:23S rRNA (cytosine1962-C5)-methyltransferase
MKIQAEMLANRVKKKYRHLSRRFEKENVEVFRLYDWDIPEIRAVVDWYAGHLVIGEYMRRQSVPEWLPAMAGAVAKALNVPMEKVHLKERRAGKQDGKRYERMDHKELTIVVSEGDLKFHINPSDYVDTGLFADHRITRRMIRERVQGKDFLNLYCYTGSFSCYAAVGGAKRTVSVDRSESAIQWAKENFELNRMDLENNRLIHGDCLEYLKKAKKAGETFDLAMVDPPSYSTTKNRNQSFDILKDHPKLLTSTLDILKPNGILFFSTNHQGFELQAEAIQGVEVKEITKDTIPEDYFRNRHPVHRCWEMRKGIRE